MSEIKTVRKFSQVMYHIIRKYHFVLDVSKFYVFLLLSVDGCKNYNVLSEADRAQGNALQNNLRSDDNLLTGWYRFQGAAGDRMPDKCVLMYRCGTRYPGWLDGIHPTVAEGVVTRYICFFGEERWFERRSVSCCFSRNIIKVKNCSSYYVYELQQPPFNNLRYCGNGGTGKLHLISE